MESAVVGLEARDDWLVVVYADAAVTLGLEELCRVLRAQYARLAKGGLTESDVESDLWCLRGMFD